jgi:proton-translocating NAD(P)+ transhydrogenase subunit alpha
MIAGVLKESHPGERRVAVIPAAVAAFQKLGIELLLEKGAGVGAGFPDSQYSEKGVTIVGAHTELVAKADLILNVRSLAARGDELAPEIGELRDGQAVVGLLDALGSPRGVEAMARRGATAFALELLPRITRAQGMDVLSSQATVVGYKAVLLAADRLPRLFPMLMTAGGTLAPAKVLVIGVGVAGLQAIATARRLGAVVSAYDVRPAVKEQVESLGARFVELPLDTQDTQDAGGYAKAQGEDFLRKQRDLMAEAVAENDVVITTAAVPGKKAPVLVTAEMVAGMAPGSVIVDVAAEQGGNCELTRPGESVESGGTHVLGPVNLASSVANHASQMYAKNLGSFLGVLVRDGALAPDLEDEIVAGTLVCRGGEVVHERVREALGPGSGQG